MEGGEAPSFEVWESGRGSTHYRPTFWCHPQELVPPFPSPFSFTIYRYASGLDNGANEIRVDALRGSAQMKNATEPQKKKKKTMRGEGPPPQCTLPAHRHGACECGGENAYTDMYIFRHNTQTM